MNNKIVVVIAGIAVGTVAYSLGVNMEEAKIMIEVTYLLTAIYSNLETK